VYVRARLCKLQKGCTQLSAASDKVYQLLAHGRWFSPGTPNIPKYCEFQLAGPEIHWSEASTYIDPYIHHLHGSILTGQFGTA
jgi:hypothetical protein